MPPPVEDSSESLNERVEMSHANSPPAVGGKAELLELTDKYMNLLEDSYS
jgi:hypothetical protein